MTPGDNMEMRMRMRVREEIKEMLGVDPQVVGAYLRDELDRRRKREELWERLRQSVLGWLVIAVLTGLGVAVWQFVKHQITRT